MLIKGNSLARFVIFVSLPNGSSFEKETYAFIRLDPNEKGKPFI